MTKKLSTAEATRLVDQIEDLQNQISAIYAHVCQTYSAGDSNVIRDAVKARAELREAQYTASALLASFDAEDEAA